MIQFRKYGKAPYNVIVIHGGPGAPGEMAPVARELSRNHGVLEPLQAESTLEGQLRELKSVLDENGNLPVSLIGYSWGALLGFIYTAQNQASVKKLILVSSGVFEEQYAANITKTRFSRLEHWDRITLDSLLLTLDDPRGNNKNRIFQMAAEIIARADSCDPLPYKREVAEYQFDTYEKVWNDAQKLRRHGDLLSMGKHIQCPVVAIHGDYDPHPADGVCQPLSRVIKNFRFILLEHCGHCPWIERAAKDRFYRILAEELCYDTAQD
jgi:pimeloyl-ACP methyl ester carboxylesterase